MKSKVRIKSLSTTFNGSAKWGHSVFEVITTSEACISLHQFVVVAQLNGLSTSKNLRGCINLFKLNHLSSSVEVAFMSGAVDQKSNAIPTSLKTVLHCKNNEILVNTMTCSSRDYLLTLVGNFLSLLVKLRVIEMFRLTLVNILGG